jgi:hypothetical protein
VDDVRVAYPRKGGTMRRLILTLAVSAFAAASLIGTGSARDTARVFACPTNPSTYGTTKWVKRYDGGRGSTWCSDGATARTSLAGARKFSSPTGICTSSSQGRYVSIGTQIYRERTARDPAQLILLDHKAGSGNEDSLSIGKGTIEWLASVKIKWKAGRRSGSFSGVDVQAKDGREVRVPISGSFKCKRIIKTSL